MHYYLSCRGPAGPLGFKTPMTFEAAREKFAELQAEGYSDFLLFGAERGGAITNVEEYLSGPEPSDEDGEDRV